MTEITNEMWRKALKHLEQMENLAINGVDEVYNLTHYLKYRAAYDNGERSAELYNAIMRLK